MGKKQNNKIKGKIVIIALYLVLLLIISTFITIAVLSSSRDSELDNQEEKTLHYSESNKQEENELIIVGIDNKKETNEESSINEQNKNDNKTNTDIKKDSHQKENIPYYIKVNYKENVVTVYKKDSSGNYTTPVKAMLCSCGDATPTSGVYTTSDKYVWGKMQGNVWAQYAFRIDGNILFHSVPYTKMDNSTLEWWEYDKLGTSASLGCVRLTVQDAKWIYDSCVKGTQVEFYASSNPGPLGKPTTKKISDDEEVRGWDPTDPDKNNPWADYLKKKEEAALSKVAEEVQETNAEIEKEINITVDNNTINTNSNNTSISINNKNEI